jgi:hypothetical protein
MGALLLGFAGSFAQSVATPPTQLHGGTLTDFAPPKRFLELRLCAFADTNVRPLQERGVVADFSGGRAYFRNASLSEARLRLNRWELRLAYGQADDYTGNTGAARLFLEAEQQQLLPDTEYPVAATLNRSAVRSWTVAYHGAWNSHNSKVRYTIGLSYLNLQRVQLGWLQGQKQGDTLEGDLTLLTTRGVPPSEIGGEGYALSAGVALESGDWTLGVSVQNLWSHLRVRQLQRIEADVRVNRLVPDADGFLRAPPALEGRVEKLAIQRAARPHTEIALWRMGKTTDVGLLAFYESEWRTGLAFGWRGHRSMVWAAYWQPYPVLWLGYEQAHWHITLGADFWNGSTLRRFYVELGWRVLVE